ncbi:hypothetical protein CHU32_08225 [Superficieibacter electus]|uniref:Uncharacterized protein n=1 Tax=Superficieibacter electus TaxID=2022662 RepID=A0A2P5GSS9_9ENTR|nr:hypothetical protein [Superficieibacter electus]POP46887.1 hypothetical protein CHU33_05275 [Superficieibacter electus]POP49624.1 hypothetical protein CHU32_08225 [Superficieibacter electus]
MKPDQILAILRKDQRNHITAFHRSQTSRNALAHTAGITLNYHEPYYEGWAPALEMQESFIGAAELSQVMPHLVAEPWGNGIIGGVVYRLKESAQ